jgi:hypothetical protein
MLHSTLPCGSNWDGGAEEKWHKSGEKLEFEQVSQSSGCRSKIKSLFLLSLLKF